MFDTAAMSRAYCLWSAPRGSINPRSLMLIVDLFDWTVLRIEYERHGDGKYWAIVLHLLPVQLRLN